VAVHSDPDLLLVDEVLAVGDEPYQRKCLDKIAEFQKDGRSILLVSHRQDQVRQLCDRVAVLDRGILTHDGDTATGLAVLKAQYKARAPRVGVTPEVAGEKSHAIAGVETRVTQSAGEPGLSATVVVDVIKARVAWDLVLTLRTASGIVLVSIKASDYGSTPPATTGRHAVTVRFAQIPLAAGDYVLDAAVVGTGGVVIDRVNGAGAFDLSHLSAGEGLLRLSAMVEYDSPTDA
jgi:ABC-2 type transport system ATP-binding protein